MQTRRNLTVGTSVFFCTVSLVLFGAEQRPFAADRPFRIFDGRPKQIVLVTNSHGGQRQLEARLKQMPGGEKIEFRGAGAASFNGEPGKKPPAWVPKERVSDDMPVIYVVYNAVDANVPGNAHCWFAALCAWDGVEVPAFSQQMMDEALAKEKANREAIRDIAVAPPGPYRPGDTVTITWNCDPQTVARVNIDFSPGPGMWAAVPIAESAPVAGPEGGSFVWKIPASITATGKNQRESTVQTASDLCFLRIENATGPQWRTTESPFQIVAPQETR